MSELAFLPCCFSTWGREWEIPHHITEGLCLTSSRNHRPQARTRSQIRLESRFFPERATNFSTFVISSKQHLKALSFFYPIPHRRIAVACSLLYLLVAKTDLRRGSRYITDVHGPVERDRTDFQGKTVLCKCLLCASADPSALIIPLHSARMLMTRANGSHAAHSKIMWRRSWTAPQLATAADVSCSCC